MADAHKGSISKGPVLITTGLYKTTTDNDIHFNQLGKESKAKIRHEKESGKPDSSADALSPK